MTDCRLLVLAKQAVEAAAALQAKPQSMLQHIKLNILQHICLSFQQHPTQV